MQLSQLVFLLPILGIIAGLVMYRLQGRRDILRLDIVQFYFVFILSPTAYVWLKTSIYMFLRNTHLSGLAMFVTDTLFSLVFLFLFAFVVMHGLTKTFWLKKHDPLYDLFLASEYIHLWLSHIWIYITALLLVTAISLMNLWFPVNWPMSQAVFMLALLISVIVGVLIYVFIITSDPKQGDDYRLTRIIKLGLGIAFTTHASLFVMNTPDFTGHYLIFWSIFTMMSSATALAFFSYRSERVNEGLDHFLHKFVHEGWGKNLLLSNGKSNGFVSKKEIKELITIKKKIHEEIER